MRKIKSTDEVTRTTYYITNIRDDKFYSRVVLAGKETIMSTIHLHQCVTYTTLEAAVEARNSMKMDTLNIMSIKKKVSLLDVIA